MSENWAPLLFDLPPDPRRDARPRGLYASEPGTGPDGETCGTCRHAARFRPGGRTWHKCRLVRDHWSGGEATDVRLRSPACRQWEPRP